MCHVTKQGYKSGAEVYNKLTMVKPIEDLYNTDLAQLETGRHDEETTSTFGVVRHGADHSYLEDFKKLDSQDRMLVEIKQQPKGHVCDSRIRLIVP
jgi:hypothetical protein